MSNPSETTAFYPSNEKDFLNWIRHCEKSDLLCRARHIEAFGLTGLKESVAHGKMTFQPKGRGPSFEIIENQIDAFLALIGRVLGPGPAQLHKILKLVYKPHFDLLKSVDKSLDKYWGSIEFLSWSVDLLQQISQRTNKYVEVTGKFELAAYIRKFIHLRGKQYEEAVKHVRLSGAVLVQFDRLLLNDLKELVTALFRGTNQVRLSKKAEVVSDWVAMGTATNQLFSMLDFVRSSFGEAVGRLHEHHESWKQLEKHWTPSIPRFQSEIVDLVRLIESTIDQFTEQSRIRK